MSAAVWNSARRQVGGGGHTALPPRGNVTAGNARTDGRELTSDAGIAGEVFRLPGASRNTTEKRISNFFIVLYLLFLDRCKW